MRDEDFFPAIFDRPDDDGPRMVYADWLMSRDDPRGEFIVLQCELAQSPPAERAAGLAARTKELFAQHAKVWTHGLWPDHAYLEFRRGFAVFASMSAATLLKHAESVFHSGPIETLKLRAVGDAEAKALGALPHLRRAHRLDFASNQLGLDAITALVRACGRAEPEAPPVAHEVLLHTLDLRGAHLSDARFTALLTGLAPARATSLDLSFNRLGDEAVALLAGTAKRLPRLERLALVEVGAREDALAAVRTAFGARVHIANARGG